MPTPAPASEIKSAYGPVQPGESITLQRWRTLEAQEGGLRAIARVQLAKSAALRSGS